MSQRVDPAALSRGKRAAQVGILTNALLPAFKLVAGVVGNSYALIADAIESSADVVFSTIVLGGLHVAGRELDKQYLFGYGKAETVAGAVVALMLIGAAAGIAIQAIREIRTPHQRLHGDARRARGAAAGTNAASSGPALFYCERWRWCGRGGAIRAISRATRRSERSCRFSEVSQETLAEMVGTTRSPGPPDMRSGGAGSSLPARWMRGSGGRTSAGRRPHRYDTALGTTISGSALDVCGRGAAWLVYCTGRMTPGESTADTRATTLGRGLVWMTAVIASHSSGVTATIDAVSRSARLRLVTSTAIAGTTAFDDVLFRSSARIVVPRTNASTVTANRIQIVFLIITLISFGATLEGIFDLTIWTAPHPDIR